jgi:hypothetical protein
MEEAKKCDVLPLDNSTSVRFITPRPSPSAGKTVFMCSGEMSGIPINLSPSIMNRSYTIIAEVEVPQGGSEGIIVTSGSADKLSSLTVTTPNIFVEFVVTGAVQSWIANPSGNFGLELLGSGTTNVAFDSKEATGTSHPAMLEIALTGPAGPQGGQGLQGPAGPQGPAGVTNVSHDTTLAGSGTAASPLALVSPLILPGSIYAFTNTTGYPAVEGDNYEDGGYGVAGYSFDNGDGFGMRASGFNGIYASGNGWAGYFDGNVQVHGTLSKSAGSFKIDHPLDPENKYLYHSFVESPDMMNVYNGNVVTDGQGRAVVQMPEWFEALNRDFRYQLTPVGQFAQVMVASKMANNTFTIQTDKPNVEVSWQVTGVRQDAYAEAHRIPVEEEKKPEEKGRYLHPDLFGHAGQPGIGTLALRHPQAQ